MRGLFARAGHPMPVEVGGGVSVSKGTLRDSARVRGCEKGGPEGTASEHEQGRGLYEALKSLSLSDCHRSGRFFVCVAEDCYRRGHVVSTRSSEVG